MEENDGAILPNLPPQNILTCTLLVSFSERDVLYEWPLTCLVFFCFSGRESNISGQHDVSRTLQRSTTSFVPRSGTSLHYLSKTLDRFIIKDVLIKGIKTA